MLIVASSIVGELREALYTLSLALLKEEHEAIV
jgi:hypothetical protein